MCACDGHRDRECVCHSELMRAQAQEGMPAEYKFKPSSSLLPPAAAKAAAAAESKTRKALEEKMEMMEEEYSSRLKEAGRKLREAEAERKEAGRKWAVERSKLKQHAEELQKRLDAFSTTLVDPREASHSSRNEGAQHAITRSKAMGAHAPLPGDVLLEVAVSSRPHLLPPSELASFKEALVTLVGSVIAARQV